MLTNNQVIELSSFFDNKNYCIVENFFQPQLIKFLAYSMTFESFRCYGNDHTPQLAFKKYPSLEQYSSVIGDTLLTYLTPLYSSITRKSLSPTYSFLRTYFKGNILSKHTDRGACQYSATIQLGSSDPKTSYPIFLEDKNSQKVTCNSKVGDIVFYMGEKLPHWREECPVDYSAHIFLHWVDSENPEYSDFINDEREILGYPYDYEEVKKIKIQKQHNK